MLLRLNEHTKMKVIINSKGIKVSLNFGPYGVRVNIVKYAVILLKHARDRQLLKFKAG